MMGEAPKQLSFLPPAALAPTWPTRGTLADVALRLMLDGQRLTHPEFERRTGSWRLAAMVFELRALGWPVEVDHVPAPTAEAPARTIARYYLPARAFAAALRPRG